MEANKDVMYSFRLTTEEAINLERQMKLSGVKNRTKFIKSAIFNRPLKVVNVDRNTHEFYKTLINIQAQYKAIGNNYNQATKAIHTTLTDKKALAFLYQLRDATLELIKTNKEILSVTKEFEQWLQK